MRGDWNVKCWFVLCLNISASKGIWHGVPSILLKNIEHYAISGITLEWFRNYLSRRQWFIKIGTNKSTTSLVTCGVPQGSILGFLLFLIYVNDLQNYLSFGSSRLFMDDTNIIYGGNSINAFKHNAKADLEKLMDWFNINKLALNLSKSNFIIICSKTKTSHSILVF